MKRKLPYLILVVLAGFVLMGAGCHRTDHTSNTTSDDTTSEATTATGGTSVDISDFTFGPGTITVSAGDTVTWTNSDSAPHTVTSDSGGELASGTIAAGGTFSHTFTTPGTYTYHCNFHPRMTGTILVQ